MCIFKGMKKNDLTNDSSANEDSIKYITNIPVNNYGDYKKQVGVLEYAIKEEGVYNIGIVAPYGSGKSSLIKTFLANKTVYKDVSFNITLANFKENNGANQAVIKETNAAKKEGDGDELNDDHLPDFTHQIDIKNAEKSILEQLLYSVDKKIVPESNIKRISSKSCVYLLFALIFVSFVTLLLFSLMELYNVLPNSSIYTFYWMLPFLLLSFIAFVCYIPKIFKTIKVLYGDIEIGLNSTSDESILNEFIDEIIYFFKQSNIKIVFFEDIDRFDSVKLISNLREINQIINNNVLFKDESKKIKFIYCVRDDLFNSPVEKAKFFDFIVPFYPVLTVENVQQIIENTLREAEKLKEGNVSIDSSFISEISYFLKDKRLIDNIVNDYEFLRTNLNNVESNEKLFAMMVFKNLFMKEYHLLQKGEGRLYSIFHEEKNNAINAALESLRNDKSQLEQKIGTISDDERDKKRIIINAIKGIIYSNGNFVSSVPSGYASVESLDSSINRNIQGFYVDNRSAYPYNSNNRYFAYSVNSINSNFGKNIFDTLEEISTEIRNQIQEKISNISNDIEEINSYSVKQLLDNKRFDNNKIIEIDNDGFLMFALRNGYIDETYFMYIGELDSQLDTDLIVKIISESDIDCLTNVDNPLKVINKLNVTRFNTKQILICPLIEGLLSFNGVSDKKKCFLDYLSKRSTDTKNFVARYYANNYDIIKLISAAYKNYKYIVFDMLESNILSNVQKDGLVVLLHRNKLLERYNIDNCITDYVKKHNSPISSIFTSFDSNDIVFGMLKILNIEKLDNLSYDKTSKFENAVFDEIVHDSMYEINFVNLATIYNIVDEISLSSMFEKSEYLKNNKVLVLKSLVEHRVQFSDDEKTVKEILTDSNITLELRQSYVELLKSVHYIEKLDTNIYNAILNYNKCQNWVDLIKISKVLPSYDYNQYILNNYKVLSGEITEKPLIVKFINSDLVNDNSDIVDSISKAISSTVTFNYSEVNKDIWITSLIASDHIKVDKYLLTSVANKSKSILAILKKDNSLIDELGNVGLSRDDYLTLLNSDLPKSARRSIVLKSYNQLITDKLSDGDFEKIFNLVYEDNYKNDTPYDLISYLYNEKNNDSKYCIIAREKMLDIVRLSEAYLCIKMINPELYYSLSNDNNPIEEVKIGCSQYENNKIISKLIELNLIYGKKNRKNARYYTVNVAKLFNLINS